MMILFKNKNIPLKSLIFIQLLQVVIQFYPWMLELNGNYKTIFNKLKDRMF